MFSNLIGDCNAFFRFTNTDTLRYCSTLGVLTFLRLPLLSCILQRQSGVLFVHGPHGCGKSVATQIATACIAEKHPYRTFYYAYPPSHFKVAGWSSTIYVIIDNVPDNVDKIVELRRVAEARGNGHTRLVLITAAESAHAFYEGSSQIPRDSFVFPYHLNNYELEQEQIASHSPNS